MDKLVKTVSMNGRINMCDTIFAECDIPFIWISVVWSNNMIALMCHRRLWCHEDHSIHTGVSCKIPLTVSSHNIELEQEGLFVRQTSPSLWVEQGLKNAYRKGTHQVFQALKTPQDWYFASHQGEANIQPWVPQMQISQISEARNAVQHCMHTQYLAQTPWDWKASGQCAEIIQKLHQWACDVTMSS